MKACGWGVSAAEFRELLRRLRFDHFKWDAYACGRCLIVPEAMVLTRDEHRRVVATVEAISRALGRLEERIRREPELLAALGIPQPLSSLIAEEEECPLQLARYDLFPTGDGRWMISEFNEDVPGGFNEAAGLPRLLGGVPSGRSFEGDLARAVAEAFDEKRVALMFATGYSEDLQHMLLVERWLREKGCETRLCSPAHLSGRFGRPTISGWPFDAAFRFYPGEWIPLLPNLRTWRRLGPGLRMMNPLRRLIRQSKKVFALWREQPVLDPDDRRLLDEHTPASRRFSRELLPELEATPSRWVIKHAFGRMGDTVVMGSLVGPSQWSDALREAVSRPENYLVQECFPVAPLQFEAGLLYPTIGAYVVNGRFAGYYSRAAASPFLNHEAYHVATLVEDS
jgi:glutathionylspermidine synthase